MTKPSDSPSTEHRIRQRHSEAGQYLQIKKLWPISTNKLKSYIIYKQLLEITKLKTVSLNYLETLTLSQGYGTLILLADVVDFRTTRTFRHPNSVTNIQ